MKKRALALIILLIYVLGLSGCTDVFVQQGDDDGVIPDTPQEEVVFVTGEGKSPAEWADGSADGYIPIYLCLGESADISGYITDSAEGVEWRSECNAVASVAGGRVDGNKIGRTEIFASKGGEVIGKFLVTVEFKITTSGYDFSTTKVDQTVYKVASVYDANRIIDIAAANHVQKLTIDFSLISEDFSVKTDFELNSEFGSHTALKMKYYPSTPYHVEFEIIYNTNGASFTTPESAEYEYATVKSANAIIRSHFGGASRSDDFDDFAINSREESFDVYNSEELWWAVEHGYKPSFPIEGTKAELFYERAKMILREIITDGMSDYEKALAIYDYLLEAVNYDYAAYYNVNQNGDEKDNTCYYLEGVFEEGRAVCDGKSKAYVLLCGIEGIECVRAFGSALASGGVGHAWNYVKIGDVWYLVDTTEGDVRYDGSSSISGFFGSKFETTSYEGFLLPTYYHSEKYEYTDMWEKIIKRENSAEYPVDYYDFDIGSSSLDFIIQSKDEARALFEALYSEGVPEVFVFSFVPQNTMWLNFYFQGIESTFSIKLEIYKISGGDGAVYLALGKKV